MNSIQLTHGLLLSSEPEIFKWKTQNVCVWGRGVYHVSFVHGGAFKNNATWASINSAKNQIFVSVSSCAAFRSIPLKRCVSLPQNLTFKSAQSCNVTSVYCSLLWGMLYFNKELLKVNETDTFCAHPDTQLNTEERSILGLSGVCINGQTYTKIYLGEYLCKDSQLCLKQTNNWARKWMSFSILDPFHLLEIGKIAIQIVIWCEKFVIWYFGKITHSLFCLKG